MVEALFFFYTWDIGAAFINISSDCLIPSSNPHFQNFIYFISLWTSTLLTFPFSETVDLLAFHDSTVPSSAPAFAFSSS